MDCKILELIKTKSCHVSIVLHIIPFLLQQANFLQMSAQILHNSELLPISYSVCIHLQGKRKLSIQVQIFPEAEKNETEITR